MTSAINIAISGGLGRMGQALILKSTAESRFSLRAVSEHAENIEALRRFLALSGVDAKVTDDPVALAASADAVIDFTSPPATLSMADAVAGKGGIHIIGTTGSSESEQQKLSSLAARARIVQSGNFSLGVSLLSALVEQAAARLSADYDIEIFEMHHRHKKDAPSGTALMLGRAAAKGRAVDFPQKQQLARDGERKRGDIGFSVARGGDVVGIHDVIFAGPGETLTLSHQGFDRSIYANGALAAALWAKDKSPGLYSMRDVLGL